MTSIPRVEGDPLADSDDELLTLQEAADRLKVHYMTAYRWVRRGELPAFKAGGRIRCRRSDVDDFLEARTVDAALPHPREGRTDWDAHSDRLYELLVGGDDVGAMQLVRRVVADGAPAGDAYLRLLSPVLHRIGDAWEAGDITVADEHRASEICSTVVARMGESFRRRGPARGVAVTMTPPEEQHGLAAAMAAQFLRAGGFDVHHLGTNVPLDDLRLFLAVVPADLLCVSVTCPLPPHAYVDLVAAARGHAPIRVVFGGQGVDRDAAEQAGAEWIDDLAELTGRTPVAP